MKEVKEAEARWSGKCPGCGERIVEGHSIFLIEDEWVCERCREEWGG